MTQPRIVKWSLSGPCRDALSGVEVPGYGACYVEYGEVTTTDGQVLPAQRCPCTCHRTTDEGVPA